MTQFNGTMTHDYHRTATKFEGIIYDRNTNSMSLVTLSGEPNAITFQLEHPQSTAESVTARLSELRVRDNNTETGKVMLVLPDGRYIVTKKSFIQWLASNFIHSEKLVGLIPPHEKSWTHRHRLHLGLLAFIIIAVCFLVNSYRQQTRQALPVSPQSSYRPQQSPEYSDDKTVRHGDDTKEMQDSASNIYIESLQRQIKRHWRPMKSNRSNRVATSFVITKDHRLQSITITESSGDPRVDQAAINALNEVTAPPLPKHLQPPVDVTFTFDYNVKAKPLPQ